MPELTKQLKTIDVVNAVRPGFALAILLGILIASFVVATEIFLILFLGLLFGVFLTKSAAWVNRKTPFEYSTCVGLTTVSLLGISIAFTAVFGMKIESQVSQAADQMTQAQTELQQAIQRRPVLRSILSSTPFVNALLDEMPRSTSDQQSQSPPSKVQTQAEQIPRRIDDSQSSARRSKPDSKRSNFQPLSLSDLPSSGTISTAANQVASFLSRLFQTTLGLIVNSALIFFVGLFLAVAPEDYRDGVIVLFPKHRRERIREVMNLAGESLWNWLVGRFGSMLVTGTGAFLILFLCGVPMAILLGMVTAALTFVPNIGGLIALMLAILFAIPQGSTIVAVVIVGYGLLQLIESYLVTPLIQKNQTSLPPALLIGFQALMGVLFGFLGAAVASPVLAATKTLTEELYVKDVLSASCNAESAQ